MKTVLTLTKDKWHEFERFNETSRKGHIFQSGPWAKLKQDWDREIVAVYEDGVMVAGMSILVRPVPLLPYTLFYSPRGPVCDPHDGESITLLFKGAQELAKKRRAFELKLDPDVVLSDKLFLEHMKNAGVTLIDPKKEKFIQPRFVYRLDMEGMDEEAMQAQFHHKTRYNIRLAARKGVTVELHGAEAVPEFCRLMDITGKRDGFTSRSPAYFTRMLNVLGPDHCRLYMAKFEDQYIAATLALQCGDKTWYTYGASDNENRNAMPNYLLQMEMLRWAIEKGCNIYDFRGVTDHTGAILEGLVTFKKGFGAVETEFPGQFYVCYKPLLSKMAEQGLRARKWLRGVQARRKLRD